MITFDDTLFIGLGRTKHNVAHGINLSPSTLPKKSVGELDIEIAQMDRRWRLAYRRKRSVGHAMLGQSQVAG